MRKKPIIIIWGEPNSVFSEILIKTLKNYKNKKPIIFIGSKNLIELQLKKMRLKNKFNSITLKNYKLDIQNFINFSSLKKEPSLLEFYFDLKNILYYFHELILN